MKIVRFDTLNSTNQYCELLDLSQVEEFTIVVADTQTAGIGQRGNHWEAEPGKNLTFSIILKPTFLQAADQYQLTKAVSLGIYDWLQAQIPATMQASIKWPNDLYVGESKICGTLISSRLAACHLSSTIVGIGLNINQTQFSDWIPNPTSLAILCQKTFDTTGCLEQLANCVFIRYMQLRNDLHSPDKEYLQHLLDYGQPHAYVYQGQRITATITGINKFGHLEATTADGQEIVCQIKEISRIL